MNWAYWILQKNKNIRTKIEQLEAYNRKLSGLPAKPILADKTSYPDKIPDLYKGKEEDTKKDLEKKSDAAKKGRSKNKLLK